MNPYLSSPYEGHHAAAARLAEAIEEATLATLQLDALPEDALDGVVGGRAPEVYWASQGFLSDWRVENHRKAPPLEY